MLSDDGFQLEESEVQGAGGALGGLSGVPAQLHWVQLQPSGADMSGDGAVSRQPIRGLTQPLDMVSMEGDGVDRLFTADGGVARTLPDPAGGQPFDERARLGGRLLDTGAFPGAAALENFRLCKRHTRRSQGVTRPLPPL